MQLDHAGERVELRILVDEGGVVALRRRRHKRIRKRNFVRRFQLRGFIAQRIVRMVPSNRKFAKGGAYPGGLLFAAIVRQDISHLRKGDKGCVEFHLSAFAGFEPTLHALKPRLLVCQRHERGSIEQKCISHGCAPFGGLQATPHPVPGRAAGHPEAVATNGRRRCNR